MENTTMESNDLQDYNQAKSDNKSPSNVCSNQGSPNSNEPVMTTQEDVPENNCGSTLEVHQQGIHNTQELKVCYNFFKFSCQTIGGTFLFFKKMVSSYRVHYL